MPTPFPLAASLQTTALELGREGKESCRGSVWGIGYGESQGLLCDSRFGRSASGGCACTVKKKQPKAGLGPSGSCPASVSSTCKQNQCMEGLCTGLKIKPKQSDRNRPHRSRPNWKSGPLVSPTPVPAGVFYWTGQASNWEDKSRKASGFSPFPSKRGFTFGHPDKEVFLTRLTAAAAAASLLKDSAC